MATHTLVDTARVQKHTRSQTGKPATLGPVAHSEHPDALHGMPASSSAVDRRNILSLQRAIGNRAVVRMMADTPHRSRVRIQPKLSVGQAGDRYEQEADRVAQQVMKTPANAPASGPGIQRAPEAGEEALTRHAPVQDSFEAGEGFESRLNAARNGGSPLPDATRAFMEPRIGADFSGVRLHTGSASVQLNREVKAHAFTHGHDIFLGEGRGNVESSQGQKLLAHELTHVVQQTGAKSNRVSRSSLKPGPGAAGRIQRFSIDDPNMNFGNATRVWPSSGGATGVIFVDDGTAPVVVKPSDPVRESRALSEFISMLHSKAGSSKASIPKNRPLQGGEQGGLVTALRDPAKRFPRAKWQARSDSTRQANNAQMSIQEVADEYVRQYAGAGQIYVTAISEGQEFKDLAAQANNDDRGLAKRLMQDSDHLCKLGIVSAVDLFLHIGDRLDAGNIGNWFINPQGTENRLGLIDNFSSDNATLLQGFDPQGEMNRDIYEDRLSADKLPATAKELVRGLVRATTRSYKEADRGGVDWGNWWTAKRIEFAEKHILRGLKMGRERLLRKILGTRFRSPSKSMKGALGANAWSAVQSRASYIKKNKDSSKHEE
jgi:hypothetical protein